MCARGRGVKKGQAYGEEVAVRNNATVVTDDHATCAASCCHLAVICSLAHALPVLLSEHDHHQCPYPSKCTPHPSSLRVCSCLPLA